MATEDDRTMIVLTEAAFACLKEYVSATSPAYAALERTEEHGRESGHFGGRVVVACYEADAEAMLVTAERSCPAAVDPIQRALYELRLRRTK